MIIRRTVHYSGRVQGVGFRYTAVRVSQEFDVVGTVRNLLDGRVELVAEGSTEEVDRFLAAIDAQLGGLIQDVQTRESPAVGQFTSFDIAF
jgi:acylphosphatase